MIKLFGQSQILSKDEVISCRRVGSVVPVDGKMVQHEVDNFTVIGNVQPMAGRDLLMVPEYDRFKEQYWLWIKNKNFYVTSGLDVEPKPILKVNDIVTRLRANYQVQNVQVWGSYVRCHMMRLDVGPYATPGGLTSD